MQNAILVTKIFGGYGCFYPKVIWTIFNPFGNYYIQCLLIHYQALLDQKNDLVNYNNYKEKIFPKAKNIQNIYDLFNYTIIGLKFCMTFSNHIVKAYSSYCSNARQVTGFLNIMQRFGLLVTCLLVIFCVFYS